MSLQVPEDFRRSQVRGLMSGAVFLPIGIAGSNTISRRRFGHVWLS